MNDADLAVAVLTSGNRNFEGSDQPGRQDELPGVAAAGGGLRDRRPDGPGHRLRAAGDRGGRPARVPARDLAHARGRSPTRLPPASTPTCSPPAMPTCSRGMPVDESRHPDGSYLCLGCRPTYVRKPPYFDDMAREPSPVADIVDARCWRSWATPSRTDHISPAGAIRPTARQVPTWPSTAWTARTSNSYGSRRGKPRGHDRGTFANIRLHNQLVPGVEGDYGRLHQGRPSANNDLRRGPVVCRRRATAGGAGGKEYGSVAPPGLGGERDSAARGASGYCGVLHERIHRSEPHRDGGCCPAAYPAGLRQPTASD